MRSWRAPGMPILERYGMTETGMITSNPLDGARVGGTVGKPLPGIEVRIVDAAGQACVDDAIGGVEVRGPNVFAGYWRMEEKTREEFSADGFFKTGDMGQWVNEGPGRGYLRLVGRAKDLIITGGLNVYPKEIEELIDQIDGVRGVRRRRLARPGFRRSGRGSHRRANRGIR